MKTSHRSKTVKMGAMRLEKLSFLLPALLLIFIMVIYPILATILLSFNIDIVIGAKVSDKPPSLENYFKAFSSRELLNWKGVETGTFPMGALIHNALWVAIHLPITTILGLLLAVLLQNVKGASIIRSLIFLGMVVPMIVGGLLIAFSFDKDIGIVNFLLNTLGLKVFVKTWTTYPDTALFALILGSVWLWTGFSVVTYSAGLASIPKEIIEAALIDGAKFRTILFKIIIPLLKPVTVAVVAMTIIWDLKIFDIVYVATRGGPGGASMVLSILMWDYFARVTDYTMSATIATILTFIILPVAIIWVKLVMRGR